MFNKICPLLCLLLSASAFSIGFDIDKIPKNINIDTNKPTIILIQQKAQLVLEPTGFKIKAIDSDKNSSIWHVQPKCRKQCKTNQIEFLLQNGMRIVLNLSPKKNYKDHLVKIRNKPLIGNLVKPKIQYMKLARNSIIQYINFDPIEGVKIEEKYGLGNIGRDFSSYDFDRIELLVGNRNLKNFDIKSFASKKALLAALYKDKVIIALRK